MSLHSFTRPCLLRQKYVHHVYTYHIPVRYLSGSSPGPSSGPKRRRKPAPSPQPTKIDDELFGGDLTRSSILKNQAKRAAEREGNQADLKLRGLLGIAKDAKVEPVPEPTVINDNQTIKSIEDGNVPEKSQLKPSGPISKARDWLFSAPQPLNPNAPMGFWNGLLGMIMPAKSKARPEPISEQEKDEQAFLSHRTSIQPHKSFAPIPSIKPPSALEPIQTAAQTQEKQRSRFFSVLGQICLAIGVMYLGSKAWMFYFEEAAKLHNHSYHPFTVEGVERDEEAGTVRIRVKMPWGSMGERMWFERNHDLIPEEQERLLSIFIKQPQLQIERPYTPLYYPFRHLEQETTVDTLKKYGVLKKDRDTLDKHDSVLELLVKRYDDGEMSRYLWSLKPGDTIELKGLFENWGRRWANAAVDFTDYYFIVGGTGITAFHQFAARIFSLSPDPYDSQQNRFMYYPTSANTARDERQSLQPFSEALKPPNFAPTGRNPPPYPGEPIPPNPRLHLIYASRSPETLFLKDEIDELRERYPDNFKVWYFVDKPSPTDDQEKDTRKSSWGWTKYHSPPHPPSHKEGTIKVGRMTLDDLRQIIGSRETWKKSDPRKIFVCGPDSLIETVAGRTQNFGWHFGALAAQGKTDGWLKELGYTEEEVWKLAD